MNHVFGEHIGRTVEAYVDDIVVKTRKASDLLSDLEVTFGCLRAKGVKLNPEKCVFGVPRGMLLGFIVSERGIEANPEKIAAITNMGPIKDLKGVQRVMGCLAALKGKCALGPLLSILVIECQRKCFCVDLCNVVDKVQIISKGMILDLVHCFMD
jgi:hypothetical protein